MRPYYRIAVAVVLLSIMLSVQACKIPEYLTPYVVDEIIKAWRKVKTNKQVMKIWPDKTAHPEKEYTFLYRDSMMGTAKGAFRFDAISPAEDKGFCAGFSNRTFWMKIPKNRVYFKVEGLPAYDEKRAMKLLKRIVWENLRTMDYSMSKITWEEHKALKTIATPDPWDNKFYHKMTTIADTETRVIKQAQLFDKNDTPVWMWQVTEYEKDIPLKEKLFSAPIPKEKNTLLKVDLKGGAPWDGNPIKGLDSWFSSSEKGKHKVYDSEFGQFLVSDFGDGVNLRLLVQIPKAAPDIIVPWAKEMKINNARVFVSLLDGSVFITIKKGDRHSVILAQDNLLQVIEFVDRLTR